MPENTEAMPEISASPAPQDAKPADTGEKKQKKPRNTSGMKPPLNQLPPEEAFAIRSKGGKAAAKKRREEKLVKDALLNLLTKPQHKKKGGKAHYKASAELTSYDDVFSENTTLMVQMLIPLIQSAINGNIESLFAILRVLGQEPPPASLVLTSLPRLSRSRRAQAAPASPRLPMTLMRCAST